METSAQRIGETFLNPDMGRLEDRHGNPRHLRPKSFQVLSVLHAKRGTLVSKDDLASLVWPDVAVSDESLSQCISDIRRALGSPSSKLLRTVPRRGFVLDRDSKSLTPQVTAQQRNVTKAMLLTAIAIVLVAGLGIIFTTAGEDRPVSEAEIRQSLLTPPIEWTDRAKNEAQRQLVQDRLAQHPDDSAAWADLALTYWREVQFDQWGGGRKELQQAFSALERAFQLGGAPVAYLILAEIRLDVPYADERSAVDALAAAQTALVLAPNNPDCLAMLADALSANGHASDAVPVIEEAIARIGSPSDRYREIAGLTYLLAGKPANAAQEFGRLHGAATFAGARRYAGWSLAASLAHSGRIDDARQILHAALSDRPEQTADEISLSIQRQLGARNGTDVILAGLSLAGLPQ